MEKQKTKIPVKILSYNLNLLPKGVNPVGHRYKSNRLTEFLKCLPDYDILALQEVLISISSMQNIDQIEIRCLVLLGLAD